jgi:cell division protein FtsB
MTFDPADGQPPLRTTRARRRLRTAEETRERRRRQWTLGLSLALCGLLVNSIVGENGYLATVRYRAEQAELEAAVARLRRENQALQEEGRRLREDPAALEEEARRSLGLIRPGETLLVVAPLASGATHPSTAR